jgi:hypothetical protein
MDRKTKVIIVGDSFTFGHGCADRVFYYDHKLKVFVGDYDPFRDLSPSEHCWAALLQREYPNLEVVNLAKPGHCNTAIFKDAATYLINNEIREGDILLYNGTKCDRIEVATGDNGPPVSWVMGWDHMAQQKDVVDYNIAKKLYIKYLYHDEIGLNYALASVMGAYGYASANKLKFSWNLPMIHYPSDPGIIDKSFLKRIPKSVLSLETPSIAAWDFSGVHDYDFNVTCVGKDYHTNDKGHVIYYEKQIKPLIEKFLNT